MTLQDDKVVIVGGSSGIGLGVAEALLAEGASVTIVGKTSEKLEAARKTLGADDRVTTVAADVTGPTIPSMNPSRFVSNVRPRPRSTRSGAASPRAVQKAPAVGSRTATG